jgi:hypothetical protein
LDGDYLPHLHPLCHPCPNDEKQKTFFPPKNSKATTNKAARKKGDGKKQCGTSSEDETVSHEHAEDENEDEDDQSFNAGAELDVDEAPEEEVVAYQDNALENQSSPTHGRFMCGSPAINNINNLYRLSLKNISKPTTDKVEMCTVLLNDYCEALLQGFPIDHAPASKKDLVVGYQLLKMFVNHKARNPASEDPRTVGEIPKCPFIRSGHIGRKQYSTQQRGFSGIYYEDRY